ncbi:MAG: MarR family transcriptional regulator [Bacteroidales bacterium]|nr:MarR family transcriptional regulator [Bacteroidales bacterium]
MRHERENISEQIQDLIKQINLNISHIFTRVIDDSPVTAHQMYIMKIIRKNQKTNLSALCRDLSLSKGAMSLAVNRLVEEGYVLRQDNRMDRRNIDIVLTEHGVQTLDDTIKKCRDVFHDITFQLKLEEMEEIVTSLGKLNSSIQYYMNGDQLNSEG